MTEETRVWQKPELLVLVRSKPEEAVLSVCKDAGLVGSGQKVCTDNPGQDNTGCAVSGAS